MASQETTPGYDPWLDVIGIQLSLHSHLERNTLYGADEILILCDLWSMGRETRL
jgi:hypothetical protein